MKEIKTHRDLMKVLSEGHTVEIERCGGWDTIKWFQFDMAILDVELTYKYRIKPSKPSIDWSHVSDEFKYLARDEDASAYLYGDKPNRGNSLWCSVSQDVICASSFKSLRLGNCDWTESLIERPKDNRL